MPVWDLATRDNWGLILTEKRIVQKTPSPNAGYDYRYNAIPPIYATANSSLVLVGARSETAQPYWFLGARVSQYLYVSPSVTPNLTSGVQVAGTQNVGLNRLTLIKFPNYGISPYILRLDIPYWLEDIYVEAWEYQGFYREEEEGYEEIISRLNDIEDKIDNLYSQ